MAAKYGIPYFSNYVNSDMEPSDIRSMCPLRGDQLVVVKNGHDSIWKMQTIEELYNAINGEDACSTRARANGTKYYVLHNGKTHEISVNKFDGLQFKKITLAGGHEIIVSTNHMNKVMPRRVNETLGTVMDLPTSELREHDCLPFNADVVPGVGLTKDDGIMCGAVAGSGSVHSFMTVSIDVNTEKFPELPKWLMDQAVNAYGGRGWTVSTKTEHMTVALEGWMIGGMISDYLEYEDDSRIRLVPKASILGRSVDFRKGFIDGMFMTCGNEETRTLRVYSEKTKDVVCMVLASLGRMSKVTKHVIKVSNLECYDIELITVDLVDGYYWMGIEKIEDIEGDTGYCFEVLNGDEPYFMLPSGLVTHNCRLRLDLRELRKKGGGFFGSGESTGSVGVVTINLPRLAYTSENEQEFYKKLDKLMDLAARSLKIKRETITNLMEAGLYPYTKRYLGTFDNHFSTIGLVGMNEAGLNAKWLRKDMTHPETQKFAKEVLNHMRERLSDYQEQYGDLYNLEATPAESTSYRFALHDRRKFPDIITANMNGTPYYTNSSHLPVGYTKDIFSALDVQDELQTLYTSGTVFHAFLGEKLPDWKAAASIVRKIAENYRLPYYTLSPTYSICKDHGYITGEHYTCPHCGEKTEVYSRITGYYRPLQNWNDGKVQEFKDRNTYDIANSVLTHDGPLDENADSAEDDFGECESCKVPPMDEQEDSQKSFKYFKYSDEAAAELAKHPRTEHKIPAILAPEDKVRVQDEVEVTRGVAIKCASIVATKTCPKCKAVMAKLDSVGAPYKKFYVEEQPELAKHYNIRTAPAVILPDGTVLREYRDVLAYADECVRLSTPLGAKV